MKPDKNKQLMLDAGSKTGAYDIEAPDQWNWVMRHATDPLERAMAWVKSNTTAFRHESPFCVSDQKLPLSYRHLAADMEWADQTAKNVLGELQKQGRVKLQAKRIWYCANVPQAYEKSDAELEQPEGEETQKRRTIGERKYSVQSTFGAYVADSIGKLPEEKLLQCLAEHEAWIPRKRSFFADLMAAGRMETDRHEDNMLLRWGIPKKRLPKRRPTEIKSVKLQLLLDLSSVQSTESPCTNSPDDFVDARAFVTQQQQQQKSPHPSTVPVPNRKSQSPSSSSSKKKPDDDAVDSPPPTKPTEDWDAVGRAAGQYFHVDDAWVQKLVARCKQHAPDITPSELAQLVHTKGPLAMKKDSPGGFLLTAVPNLCEGESFRRLRERMKSANESKAPTCACGQPISIDGECWECHERGQQKRAGGYA